MKKKKPFCPKGLSREEYERILEGRQWDRENKLAEKFRSAIAADPEVEKLHKLSDKAYQQFQAARRAKAKELSEKWNTKLPRGVV